MVRWARRPLVADTALAVVVALLTLVLVDTGSVAEQGAASPETGVVLDPPPRPVRPGETWTARIAVFRGGRPATLPSGPPPLLTVQNTRTGAWATSEATPTDEPGVYRASVVLRDAGEYRYAVLHGVSLEKTYAAKPLSAGTTAETSSSEPSLPGPLVALALLSSLPIALRRRRPVAVLAVTLAAALAAGVAYESFVMFGPLVALYTVAAHVGRPWSLTVAACTGAALPLLYLGEGGLGPYELLGVLAVFAAAWLLGDNLRTRRERAARLESERKANIRRAAAEEQARIARELHDIIGHSVSVMTIQAAAARDAFDSRPARVREALGAIEATGREALAELRRLLANAGPGEDRFAPQPGLARLEPLIEQVRAAGLEVELTTEGRADRLPPSVDLSAYRIVQEALTNTLKHAQASRARVLVRLARAELEIEVTDDGLGAAAGSPNGGQGIVGMTERVAAYGGDLRAGPAEGGGFCVRARIPLEEPA